VNDEYAANPEADIERGDHRFKRAIEIASSLEILQALLPQTQEL
jgi:hypothetical protein